jgi:hypothetical protein
MEGWRLNACYLSMRHKSARTWVPSQIVGLPSTRKTATTLDPDGSVSHIDHPFGKPRQKFTGFLSKYFQILSGLLTENATLQSSHGRTVSTMIHILFIRLAIFPNHGENGEKCQSREKQRLHDWFPSLVLNGAAMGNSRTVERQPDYGMLGYSIRSNLSRRAAMMLSRATSRQNSRQS